MSPVVARGAMPMMSVYSLILTTLAGGTLHPLRAWEGRIRASGGHVNDALEARCAPERITWDHVAYRDAILREGVTAPALRSGEKLEFAEGASGYHLSVSVDADEDVISSVDTVLRSSLPFVACDLATGALETPVSLAWRWSDEKVRLPDGGIREDPESSLVGRLAGAGYEPTVLLYQRLRLLQRWTRGVWVQSELAYLAFGLVFTVIGYYRYPSVRPENLSDLWPIYTTYSMGVAHLIASAILLGLLMPIASGSEATAMAELLHSGLSTETPAVDGPRVVKEAFRTSAERARSRRMLDGVILLINGIFGVFLQAAFAWGQARVYGAVELDAVAGVGTAVMLTTLGVYRLWVRRTPLEEALEIFQIAPAMNEQK